MSTTTMKARVTSFAPQFLIDNLERSIAYYQKIGFTLDEPWEGFYAIGYLDGLEVHLKEAPKNPVERGRRGRRGGVPINDEHRDEDTGEARASGQGAVGEAPGKLIDERPNTACGRRRWRLRAPTIRTS